MRFTIPRDIYYGENALAELKNLKGKKAVIVVGGSSMRKFGFLDQVENYLKEANLETKIIEGVEPDPSVETVMNGAAVMRKFEPDWIISIGGGSPIDAAKAMWIFYEYPDFTFEKAVIPFGLPELRQKSKFLAIPSTSGTATEVTAFSVITDYETHIKYPLADYNLTPDVAIVDPAVAQTMPPKLVAHTGMDALTHAIEAYVAALSSPFTDPLAIQAIKMIKEHLLNSFKGDVKSRNEMHIAQCLAGIAFTNALLGITHSMAHKTGAFFHIPHGCANAIYLPYVIAYNKTVCAEKYASIAQALELPGKNTNESVDALINMIKNMNKKLGIPATLKEYGIDEKEFNDNLPQIAHNTILDACTGSNPRKIDDQQMENLFKCVYYGTTVNF